MPPISLLPSPRVVSLIKQCAWGGGCAAECGWMKRLPAAPLSPLSRSCHLRSSSRRGQMSGQVRSDLSLLNSFHWMSRGKKPPFLGWDLGVEPPREPLPFPSLSRPNWYWGLIFHGGRGRPGFVRFCLFPIDFLDGSTPGGLHFALNCWRSTPRWADKMKFNNTGK